MFHSGFFFCGVEFLPRLSVGTIPAVPTLLFVAAHPDDDAFGVARSIALHANDPDLRFVLVHATDGEAGEIAPDSGVSRAELGPTRRQETRDSWEAIGRSPDRHEWLGLPDGGLSDHPFDELCDLIGSLMRDERPDIVATFGPDGITGHPDHVVLSAATTEAFRSLAADGGPGFERLLHAAIPQSSIDRWNRSRREDGLQEWDPSQPFHLRGVPDETIGIDVDTTAVIDRAIDAIRRHRTQWSYSTMDDDTALAESLRREHWVIAWPSRDPTDRVLQDIFDGL